MYVAKRELTKPTVKAYPIVFAVNVSISVSTAFSAVFSAIAICVFGKIASISRCQRTSVNSLTQGDIFWAHDDHGSWLALPFRPPIPLPLTVASSWVRPLPCPFQHPAPEFRRRVISPLSTLPFAAAGAFRSVADPGSHPSASGQGLDDLGAVSPTFGRFASCQAG